MEALKSILFMVLIAFSCNCGYGQDAGNGKDYTLVINGYDWGPAANKVILSVGDKLTEVNDADFDVKVERSFEGVQMDAEEAVGERKVIYAYVSDEKGNRVDEGNYITLVLFVGPDATLGSPIKYIRKNNRGMNQWIDYKLTITQKSTERIWNSEVNRIIPLLDDFDLKGTYAQNGINLTYGAFVPKKRENFP